MAESMESSPLIPQGTGTTNLPAPPQPTPEQVAAWMAHNAFYYGDPNGYASGAPPMYYYHGYPPPPGYTSPQQQEQALNYPQAFAYPPPYNQVQPVAPHQQQRPPRSQRRGTTVQTPTSPMKSYSRDASDDRDRSEIPDLIDIVSDNQPLLHQSGNGGDGYGSVVAHRPAVYNAPSRSAPRPVRSNTARVGLPRTNSASDFNKHPLKTSSTPLKSHRRINSDGPLRDDRRLVGSGGEDFANSGHHHGRQDSRRRSFSGGNSKRPSHRRGDSTNSMRSNASIGSVVSNISKSEFFGGIDVKGRVQMHFPFESVRLVMIDPEQPALRHGHLYVDRGVDDYDQFEEYHRLTEANRDGIPPAPQWESLDRPNTRCGCNCTICDGCIGKKNMLPAPSYMLAVEDDIYKRTLGEISAAHSTPCGLFFCGHHEDVARPSIAIATLLVTILFAGLLYLAVFTGDMQL